VLAIGYTSPRSGGKRGGGAGDAKTQGAVGEQISEQRPKDENPSVDLHFHFSFRNTTKFIIFTFFQLNYTSF
jgi:hypothetical protein